MTVLLSGTSSASPQKTATLEAPKIAVAVQENSESSIDQEALKRVSFDIEYMASDEMGGRQPGTPGIKLCEDYIVKEYKKAGLKPLDDGTYFQEMSVGNTRIVSADKTHLVLTGPNKTEFKLELGKEFQQLICRADFDLNSDIVFAGYGINAEEHNYNDFAGVDVEGKIVVVLRMEPQSQDTNSVFDGDENSRHASARQKVSAARRAKAAGIILVNDMVTADDGEADELVQADRFRTNSLPIAQVKRSVINRVLEATPLVSPTGKKLTNLKDVETLIDGNLEPLSQSLEGWTASFKSTFEVKKTTTYNIIGVIEGEGPHADESIVIGAHYDHLGLGAYGSRAPGRKEIHNGADDNATGTAAVIELARRFNKRDKKPGRRLVFICFTAEEMGLLGAIHYCENPIFPLEKTAAMINFDMIGWLRENKLTLYNWNSSLQLDPVFESANESFGFDLNKPARAFAGSDHLPFNQRDVPNVFIHTGQNAVYHTPEDDFSALNCEGALKVIDYSEKIVDGLAELDAMPTFGTPKPFKLGVLLDDEDDVVTIGGVTEGSVAEASGLKQGDIILEVDGVEMTKRRQIQLMIRRDAGKTVKMKLKRGDAEVVLNIKLKKN